MKVFVIHSGLDEEVSNQIKSKIKEALKNDIEILILTSKKKIWKLEAKSLIKQADAILLLNGEMTHKSENIGWEINVALKRNKPIFCLDLHQYSNNGDNDEYDEHYLLHKNLQTKSRFTKEFQLNSLVRKIGSLNRFIKIIQKHKSGHYDIFNEDIKNMSEKELIEQYKIYLTTSETLVSRRQTVSNFYITVNGAIIAVAGAVSPFTNNIISSLILIISVAIFGIILDASWIRILESYGVLNSSKMKIINMLEERLPARLYENEWTVMSDKLNNKKYVSFTDSEKRIPKLFLAIYLLAVIVASGLLIYFLINR